MPIDHVSDSKFNQFRAIVNMAHADGHIHEAEKKLTADFIEKMPFEASQKQTLQTELEGGSNIDEILPLVSDPADRAQVVHFARVLCHCDGALHPDEKQLLEKIHSHVFNQTDVQKALKTLSQTAELSESVADQRPKFYLERFFEWVLASLR